MKDQLNTWLNQRKEISTKVDREEDIKTEEEVETISTKMFIQELQNQESHKFNGEKKILVRRESLLKLLKKITKKQRKIKMKYKKSD